VVGTRVLQLDRRSAETRDADGVRARFGIPPESIPDYLALVGDPADGFPGLPGFGARSASALLARYGHLEAIPTTPPAGTRRCEARAAGGDAGRQRETRCSSAASRRWCATCRGSALSTTGAGTDRPPASRPSASD